MKTTPRFEAAVQKLYTAFHNDSLHPECSKQCAVGTLLDNTDSWKHLSDEHGSLQLNYVGKVHQTIGRRFNGYSPFELLRIEQAFLRGCGYQLPLHHDHIRPLQPNEKNYLFDGLCEAITVLCKLDHLDGKLPSFETLLREKRRPTMVS